MLLVHGHRGRVRIGARCQARSISLGDGEGILSRATENHYDDCARFRFVGLRGFVWVGGVEARGARAVLP